MAKMKYEKTITKLVKPSVVNLHITIMREGKDAIKVLSDLNNIRELCKDFIISKKSYKENSYKQFNVNFMKLYKNKTVYKNKNKASDLLSEDEYKNLKIQELTIKEKKSIIYEKMDIKVFDKYEASIVVTAALNNSDTVIDDFTNIINMAIDKKLTCTYDYNITDNEQHKYDLELYTECVNEGINEIKEIISGFNFKHNDINLLSISTDSEYGNTTFGIERTSKYSKRLDTSYYEPEQYFIPDLIKELFNNNIELKKTLILFVEF